MVLVLPQHKDIPNYSPIETAIPLDIPIDIPIIDLTHF